MAATITVAASYTTTGGTTGVAAARGFDMPDSRSARVIHKRIIAGCVEVGRHPSGACAFGRWW